MSAVATDPVVEVDVDLDSEVPCTGEHPFHGKCPYPARWRAWRSCCNGRPVLMCNRCKVNVIDGGMPTVCGFCDALHIPGRLITRRLESLGGRTAA